MISRIKKEIEKIIPAGIEAGVSASEKKEFGDYSTNVAFRLVQTMKKSPMEIAEGLAKKISGNDFFKEAKAVAPGFVNLWLAEKVLTDELKEILKSKKLYGSVKEKGGKKINVEFVSANPTGPLTMANGRGGFYGDVLANVLKMAGNKVTREYYVNDAGNQLLLLGESILAAQGEAPKEDIHYQGAYIKELAKKIKSKGEPDPEEIGQKAAAILLKEIKSSLKKAGIRHDVWFSEYKELRKKGELDKMLDIFKKKGILEKKDDAYWLNDAVVIKFDGEATYYLADLAYHYNKFIKRKFDIAIDIWGADHHGYLERMKKGMVSIGVNQEKLKIIITQLVRLVSGGKEVRMSKRKGEFITMDELLKEVGADAARFFFLMHSPDTHMDFDLDLAKEHSQKNPVYYCQYAYVRASNILAKSNKAISHKPLAISHLDLLKAESEKKLILDLMKFPDVILETAGDYQAHRLATYALELARTFHNFYEKERVIGVGKELEQARLALVLASKIVFENLFDVLGISKPKKM